ncbi:hypothetical protein B0H10DRAFT_2053351 [Mycena sp. CBHHK59/15]|nr:hypothetical protein B0H10DRAFT_2053351 [Mycena sp. CBHHK59/15]
MPYAVPSWTPPPARLVCIAHSIYPHWKHRRSLVNGRRIRPSLNYYEKDFSDQAYKCFSKRDTKTPHNTRAFANALLSWETVKKPAVAPSPPWNAGWPLSDMLLPLETPGLVTRSLLPPSAPTPDPTLEEQNITASSLEPKRPRTTSSEVEQKESRARRNRIAAQNSRNRRKAQFSYLERRVSELEEENRQLRAGLLVASTQLDPRKAEEQKCEQAKARENEGLRERIKTLEKGWEAFMEALAAQGLSASPALPAPAPAPAPQPRQSNLAIISRTLPR